MSRFCIRNSTAEVRLLLPSTEASPTTSRTSFLNGDVRFNVERGLRSLQSIRPLQICDLYRTEPKEPPDRDSSGGSVLDRLWSDVRPALRMMAPRRVRGHEVCDGAGLSIYLDFLEGRLEDRP